MSTLDVVEERQRDTRAEARRERAARAEARRDHAAAERPVASNLRHGVARTLRRVADELEPAR